MRTSPLKTLRLEASLSQAQLAHTLGVSPQLIQKTEHCLYPQPSLSILHWMADQSPTQGETGCLIDYREWQREKRWDFVADKSVLNSYSPVEIRVWGGSSMMDFCKKLCLHPAQWARLELKGGSVEFCREAFLEAGLEGLWEKLSKTF